MAGIAGRRVVHGEHRWREFGRGGEFEASDDIVDHRLFRPQPLQRLDAGLRLPRLAGLRLEAIDKGLHMRALGRKLGIAGDGLGFALGANPHEIGEIALIKSQLLLIEMDNPIGHAFQQEAVMADQQHRAGEFDQPVF